MCETFNSNDALLQGIQNREKATFQTFYDLYCPPMFRYAMSMTNSRAEAEDVLQDVFLKVIECPARFRGISDLKSYLLKIIRNHCLNLTKKDLREKQALKNKANEAFADENFIESPDQNHQADTEKLNRGLWGLPTEQRELIILKNINGLSYAAIAELLGKPLQTIVSRHRVAIENLKQIYFRN